MLRGLFKQAGRGSDRKIQDQTWVLLAEMATETAAEAAVAAAEAAAVAAEAAAVEDRTGLRREVADNTDEVHHRRVPVTDRP